MGLDTKASDHTVAADYPHGLRRAQLLELYYYMRLTRTLEERMVALKRQGRIVGGVYRCLGQEADAVGSAYALDRQRGDILCPLIRNIGSLLVQGGTPREVLAQMSAVASSPTRGRELGFNFADLERGFIPHISHLGDMVSVMAGIALTFKMRNEPRVALVYYGDGATSTGAFHEGLNLAAVQRVPLVVIVEYNHYAYSTIPQHQYAVSDLVEKAKGYGVPGVQADGNDVLAVYAVSREAIDRARAGGGVTLIELKTYRRRGHAEHDAQPYVPAGEVEHWATTNDPLDRYIARLTAETNWIEAAELGEIDARVEAEIDEATDALIDEDKPAGLSALRSVLASPASMPELWFRHGPGGGGSA